MRVPPSPLGPLRKAFLLAGRARRLPRKFLARIEGESILEREIRVLRSCGLDVAVVSIGPIPLPDIEVIADPYDSGPLGGLAVARERTEEPFFLFGADMPFLEPIAIETLRSRFDGRTLVPVMQSGHWAVLHAIYARIEPRRVAAALRRGEGLTDLVAAMAREDDVRFLPAGVISERSMEDIDTPEELAGARASDPPSRPPPHLAERGT